MITEGADTEFQIGVHSTIGEDTQIEGESAPFLHVRDPGQSQCRNRGCERKPPLR